MKNSKGTRVYQKFCDVALAWSSSFKKKVYWDFLKQKVEKYEKLVEELNKNYYKMGVAC